MHPSRPLLVVAVAGLVVLAGCGGVVDRGETPTLSPTGEAAGAEGTLSVHFVNVGQAESALVIAPSGETMLIDTGNFLNNGTYVLEYLRRHDVTRVDHLVSSHADADHIGGHAAVVDYYETEAGGVGAVYDPGIAASTRTYERYLDAVERHDVSLFETREGDRIPFGGDAVDVRVLGPPEPYLANRARNENSVVLQVTFGATNFLFTGDAGAEQEAYLVERYGDRLRATVLKAGHHGGASSTGAAFLAAVEPRAVVVSSAYDSRYGHPREAFLRRLAARSIPTYWTATHGNVVFVSDGRTVTVRTQRAAPTDPLALRTGEPVAPGATTPVSPRATIPAAASPGATDGSTTASAAVRGNRLAVARVHADVGDPTQREVAHP